MIDVCGNVDVPRASSYRDGNYEARSVVQLRLAQGTKSLVCSESPPIVIAVNTYLVFNVRIEGVSRLIWNPAAT
jgi:hypothetical protein